MNKLESIKKAIEAAESVLEYYKIDGEDSPRIAIDAIKKWIESPTEENMAIITSAHDNVNKATVTAALSAQMFRDWPLHHDAFIINGCAAWAAGASRAAAKASMSGDINAEIAAKDAVDFAKRCLLLSKGE